MIGDPSTSAPGMIITYITDIYLRSAMVAALRASLGHPAKYVEVGNEVSAAFPQMWCYNYRWKDFVTALQAQFPQLGKVCI